MRFQNLGGGLSISGQFVQCGKQDLEGQGQSVNLHWRELIVELDHRDIG